MTFIQNKTPQDKPNESVNALNSKKIHKIDNN